MLKIRKKLGLYSMRYQIAKWVKTNLGPEYVAEALENYNKIKHMQPIGTMKETMLFLDMVQRIKKEM